MKAVGLLCALAALAACSDNARDSEAKPSRAALSGWTIEPGTYEYAGPDGAAGLLVLAENGTYSDAMSGGELATGTWKLEREASCLLPEGLAKRCYRFTVPDARGRFSGKAADGSTMSGRKLE